MSRDVHTVFDSFSQDSNQAYVQALQGQVEAALQKLSERLPQFGDGQGAALRDFTSSLEGRWSNSPGNTQITGTVSQGNWHKVGFQCLLGALPGAFVD